MKTNTPSLPLLLIQLATKSNRHTVAKLLIASCLTLSTAPAMSAKRLALIVGNSHYKEATLPNTIKHAQALSQRLSNLGFSVTFIKDANKSTLSQAIHTWGEQLQKEDVGLFYYAGHGAQINGENYLIPLGAHIQTEYETPNAAVSMNTVLREVESTKNAINVVIISANQKLPFSPSFQPKNHGLRRVNAPIGTTIIYPMSPDEESPDKNDQLEAFTPSLVKYIETPGLSFQQLMNLVRINVKQKTQGAQTPWQSNSLASDFYFINTSQNTKTGAENLVWQQTKKENTLFQYKKYLQQYPQGYHKIDALTSAQHLLGVNKGRELMERADYLYFHRHKSSHAFRMYQLAAQQGNIFAMVSLAKLWKSGDGTTVNLEKSTYWKEISLPKIKQLAEMGHITSQYQLGSLYYEVEENHPLAEKWFRQAAEQGHAAAQSHLGNMYFKGENVEQSYARAFELFSKASAQGNAMGQRLLNKIHEMEPRIEQNNALKLASHDKAADQEQIDAQQHRVKPSKPTALQPLPLKPYKKKTTDLKRGSVGPEKFENSLYSNNSNLSEPILPRLKSVTQKNIDSQILDKETSTSKGSLKELLPLDSKTQAILDSIDLSGSTETTIDASSVSLIQQHAKQGNAQAQNILGFMHSNGRGVTQSDKLAFSWFHKSATQENTRAQNNLGYLYLNGKGVNQNHVRALSWFYKAAEKYNPQAQNNLGYLYSNGKGVPKNSATAVDWYRKAALQGDAQAQVNLAFMYSKGKGVKKSDKDTALWYRKAADQGHAQAQFNLGWMHHLGTGMRQNDKEAIIWLLKSAEQGFPQAQNNLGWMYKNAKGVSQSNSQSLSWYQKSARRGYLTAQNYLIDMGEAW